MTDPRIKSALDQINEVAGRELLVLKNRVGETPRLHNTETHEVYLGELTPKQLRCLVEGILIGLNLTKKLNERKD